MTAPGERVVARTDDGVELALHRYRPAGPVRAVCLAAHAMMANASYFQRHGFAQHLAARGVEFFALDLRGHGLSVPPSPRRSPGWSFDAYVEQDLPAASRAVCAAAGVAASDLCYLGHSLGGLAGLAAFGTGAVAPPARLALWATGVWLPGPRGSWRRRALLTTLGAATRVRGHAPIRRLRVGSDDEPRAYIDDLLRWARTGRWTGRRGQDYLAAARAIRSPAWAVAGERDALCLPSDAELLRRALPAAAPLRRVGRSQGDALDPDHFGFFLARELFPLWDELVAFLTR